jgi:hypothetical protein
MTGADFRNSIPETNLQEEVKIIADACGGKSSQKLRHTLSTGCVINRPWTGLMNWRCHTF